MNPIRITKTKAKIKNSFELTRFIFLKKLPTKRKLSVMNTNIELSKPLRIKVGESDSYIKGL
jgi:hypothetical protein